MGRMLGTVSMGIRAPIIREGEDLAAIVAGCVIVVGIFIWVFDFVAQFGIDALISVFH